MSGCRQATQDTSWGIENIRAPGAWSRGFDGDGAHVWILDSGADSTHVNGPNGDWNPNNAFCSWITPTYSDCWEDSGGAGHGSLVHSVAVGSNNSVGYIGVAHGVSASTMVRICNGVPICNAGGAASSLDTAIAIGDPRTIINMSFSGDVDITSLREAIVRAYNSGILLVAAGGNDNSPGSGITYPAKYSQVIAVTGTTQSHGFASSGAIPGCARFSRSGPEAELSAPFEWSGMDLGGAYQTSCGTSFAAPAVVGVAALIWDWSSGMAAWQVRQRLQTTARDLGPPGRDNQFGYGEVDACDAVYCQVTFNLNGPGVRDVSQNGTWSAANVSGGTAPYSYKWYKDGALQGGATGSSYTTSFSSTGLHEIKVTVTPSGGWGWTKEKNVLVQDDDPCIFCQ